MARTDNLENFLTDVAAAIKTKKNDDTVVPAPNFDTEILNLDDGSQIVNSIINGTIEELTLPEGTTKIDDYVFYNCNKLAVITIPPSVTSIGNYAFSNCTGLTSVTIPDSVTSIGSSAFSNDTNLTSVTIPNSVTSIGNYAFAWCNRLIQINWNAGNVQNVSRDSNIFGDAGVNADGIDVIFGNSVKNIPAYLFYYPDDVVFPKIKSITIPDSVTSIGSHAFYGCTGLTSVTIPDSVTSIGGFAFAYTDLTSMVLGNGITIIEDSTFSNCTNLTSITIPDSVTNIEVMAFYSCTNLTLDSLPNSLTYIGDYAFSDCTNLTFTNIPESVKNIGGHAFTKAGNSTNTLIFKGTPSSIDSTAFKNSNFTCLKVPWSEGAVAGAPWGAKEIVYDYTEP